MPAFVKTKRDEELWSRAKKRAEEQGRAGDWAYVTGIFKKMKGGKVGGSEIERVLAEHQAWEKFDDYMREHGEKRAAMRDANSTLSPATNDVFRRSLEDFGPVPDLGAALGKIEKLAGYSKEFLDYVKGHRFRNPETGNDVVFRSLPGSVRKKVYEQWKAQQRGRKPDPRVEPSAHPVPGLSKAKARNLMRDLADDMELQAQGDNSDQYGIILDHLGGKPAPEQDVAISEALLEMARKRLKSTPKKPDDYYSPLKRWTYIVENLERSLERHRKNLETHETRERRGLLVEEQHVDEALAKFDELQSRAKRGMPAIQLAIARGDLEQLAKEPKNEKRLDRLRRRRTYLLEQGTDLSKKIAAIIEQFLRANALGLRVKQYERKKKATMQDTNSTLDEIEKIAAYSKEFMDWAKGRKFRNPNTHRDVKFVSLPPHAKEEVHRRWDRMQQHGGGEESYSKKVREDLVDWHRSDLVPSPGGKGREQAKPDLALLDEGLVYRDTVTDRGRQHVVYRLTPEGQKVVREEGGRKGKKASYTGAAKKRANNAGLDLDSTLDQIEKLGAYSPDFLKAVKGRKFRHPGTGNQVSFLSLPHEEQKKWHDRWTAAKTEYQENWKYKDPSWGGQDPFVEPSKAPPGPQQGEDDDWKYRHSKVKDKKASYPEEFMRVVENMEFRQPTTGNMVKFVSLTDDEKGRVYQRWQKMQQQKAEGGKKPKKPKRPTFSQARDAAFGALEEAGWSLKKGLKVPKAERDIDGERVVLHFKPQAVWMEVKGKAPARSLHTDIRDVDPKQWVETLGKEAKDMIELEERFKYGSTDEMLDALEQRAAKIHPKKAGPRWRDFGSEEKEAARQAFSDLMQGPLVQAVPVPAPGQRDDEPPPEPPPPAEVKRMLADRMRALARQLMVAGMRQPRQQMIEIGKALDVLLEQLDLLADQPGRQALRRRILMGLRQRIVGGK